MFVIVALNPFHSNGQDTWPPKLPSANKNCLVTISSLELLHIPNAVQHILNSIPDVQLAVAKAAPIVELLYFNKLISSNHGPSYKDALWSS